MKQLATLLFVVLAASMMSCNSTKSTVDQSNPPAKDGERSRTQNRETVDMDAIYDQLNLNSIQRDLLTQIDSKYESKLKSLRSDNNSGDRGAMRQQMQTVMAEKDAEVKKILDEEQYAKLKELMPEPAQSSPSNRPNRSRSRRN